MNDKMKAKCYRLDHNELGLSTLCVEKDKEIESLKEDNNELRELLEYKNDKIERLHSIIKEVREYIKKTKFKYCDGELCYMIENHYNNILGILDKANKEE